jgi:hypothetical protein
MRDCRPSDIEETAAHVRQIELRAFEEVKTNRHAAITLRSSLRPKGRHAAYAQKAMPTIFA